MSGETTVPNTVPVVTVDGPSGSGKGTLCQMLARHFGWHLLDSGALYRIVGLAAVRQGVSFEAGDELAKLAANLDVEFIAGEPGEPASVVLDGENISAEVRSETTGAYASKVAVYPAVRDALMLRQQAFAQVPGLVADGRDMGTVVFQKAPVKIFLTASAEERAQRRYKQLINKGESVNLAALLEDIKTRDERDMNRAVAPLKPADDAQVLDSTEMAIEDVFKRVKSLVNDALTN